MEPQVSRVVVMGAGAWGCTSVGGRCRGHGRAPRTGAREKHGSAMHSMKSAPPARRERRAAAAAVISTDIAAQRRCQKKGAVEVSNDLAL